LEGDGMTKPLAMTKREVLELLSKQLRRDYIEPESFLKVMDAYAKLQGWDKTKNPSPTNSDLTVDELVAQVEKKRKAV
jgi:hypothetical protein